MPTPTRKKVLPPEATTKVEEETAPTVQVAPDADGTVPADTNPTVVPVATVEDTEDTEDTASLEAPKDLLFIYKPECLACLQLCETGIKVYQKCHYTAGNDSCPAATIRIVVGVPIDRAATSIVGAMRNNDLVRLGALTAKLQERDETVVNAVMEMVRKKLKE
jgi:hypothetical protein